ncbi:MAG: response regulator [Deltaproteobacteria bacterium]|nr:response regulator [Deltaproteobacteria bacterium]
MKVLWLEGGRKFGPKIQQELGARGITVTPVEDISACLQTLVADPDSAVVIDLDLYRKGVEAIQAIHKAAADVPVIAFASLERLPVVEEAFKHGAWDSVIKQLDLSHLYELPWALVRCAEKKRLRAEATRYREEAEKVQAQAQRCRDEAERLQTEILKQRENAENVQAEGERHQEEMRRIQAEVERYRELAQSAQVQAKGAGDEILNEIIDDLQTPLAVMLGYLQVAATISEDQAEPNQILSIKRTELMARRLTDLVASHTGAMELDAKRLEIHKSPLQIDQILESAVETKRSEAVIKDVEIVVDVAKDLPPIPIDGVQMERAIGMLLGNAINLSPLGGSVKVSAKFNGNELALAFTDSGAGLSPEEIPVLFDKRAKLRRPGGDINTVGLYLAHEIVARHGGRIDVQSEPMEGATLTILLHR